MGEKAAEAKKEAVEKRKKKPTKRKIDRMKKQEPIEHEIPETALYHLKKLQFRLKTTEKVFKEMQEMYNEELNSFLNTLNLPQNIKVDIDLARGSVLVFDDRVPEEVPNKEGENIDE